MLIIKATTFDESLPGSTITLVCRKDNWTTKDFEALWNDNGCHEKLSDLSKIWVSGNDLKREQKLYQCSTKCGSYRTIRKETFS